MTKTLSGAALLLFTAMSFVYNALDTIADLKDWHALETPAVVAVIGKQLALVVMSALGGTLVGNGGKA